MRLKKMLSERISETFQNELWGFCALLGLSCVQVGIVLTVFALKDMTSHPGLIETLGIFLIVVGVIATFSSCYFHRQMRAKHPMFPCCARVCACCNSGYEADLIERDQRPRSRRTAGYPDRGNSIKQGPKLRPLPTTVTSGFATPGFRILTDFMKRDRKVAQDDDEYDDKRDNNTTRTPDYSKTIHDRLYVHPSRQVHLEKVQEKHRQNVPTVANLM